MTLGVVGWSVLSLATHPCPARPGIDHLLIPGPPPFPAHHRAASVLQQPVWAVRSHAVADDSRTSASPAELSARVCRCLFGSRNDVSADARLVAFASKRDALCVRFPLPCAVRFPLIPCHTIRVPRAGFAGCRMQASLLAGERTGRTTCHRSPGACLLCCCALCVD